MKDPWWREAQLIRRRQRQTFATEHVFEQGVHQRPLAGRVSWFRCRQNGEVFNGLQLGIVLQDPWIPPGQYRETFLGNHPAQAGAVGESSGYKTLEGMMRDSGRSRHGGGLQSLEGWNARAAARTACGR
ncbi:hypothetical protein D3C80_1638240 [compost metagenome]